MVLKLGVNITHAFAPKKKTEKKKERKNIEHIFDL